MPKLIQNIKGKQLTNIEDSVKMGSIEGYFQKEDYINFTGFIAFLQNYTSVVELDSLITPLSFGLKQNKQQIEIEIDY